MIQEVRGETYEPGQHVRAGTDPLTGVHVIRGAGMDATYLDLGAAFVAGPGLLRLTLLDLTVDAGRCGLLRATPEHPVLLRVAGSRLIGGPRATLVAAERALVFVTDSRIETGYGAKEGGRLFAEEGVARARFARCRLVGPLDGLFPDASVFTQVTFSRFDASFAETLSAPPPGVRFDACNILPLSDDAVAASRAHLLRDVAVASGTHRTLLPLWYDHRERRRMPLSPILEPTDGFARLIEPKRAEVSVQIPRTRPIDRTVGRVRVSLPAGVHVWPHPPRSLRSFEGDLVIEGAGRACTLLDAASGLLRLRIRSLVLRDLTLHAEKTVIDLRGMRHLAAVRLERCRVVGFGGGRFLDAREPLLLHTADCAFDAGIGRRVTSLSFLDVRDHVLAVLERCSIDMAGGEFLHGRAEGTLLLRKCELRGIAERDRDDLEGPRSVVRQDGGSIAYRKPDAAVPAPRPLAELNPAWEASR